MTSHRHCRCFGQYRTKSVWRLCTPSACKFPVIFHKNAREYIKYSLRFLFHLTKNLTTHLSHNLCAVLPYVFSANFVAYCVKNSCHTKVCLQIFALSAKKFARKSAYISYEHKLLEKNPRFEKNGESLVRMTGLEPAHLTAQEPKSCVSANSTNSAQRIDFIIFIDNCQGFYSELFLLTIVYIALF